MLVKKRVGIIGEERWYIHSDSKGFKVLFGHVSFEEHGQMARMCTDGRRRDFSEFGDKEETLRLAKDLRDQGFKAEVFFNFGNGIRPYVHEVKPKETRVSLSDLIKRILGMTPATSK